MRGRKRERSKRIWRMERRWPEEGEKRSVSGRGRRAGEASRRRKEPEHV